METRRYSILIALTVVAGGVGCARHTSTRTAQRLKPIRKPASVQLEWGPAASGLECRLRPVRRMCPAGESPAFRVDLRNRGGRVFAFIQNERAPLDRFAVDGRWFPWPDRPPVNGKTVALGPGVEFSDLQAGLPANAQPYLTPGPHIVQVAFSFEGVQVVSNPVEIEIAGQ